jgi:hypothetical protein
MKKLFLLFALSLVWGITKAQDTIRVAPDYINNGSLEKAIADNGPNKVYLLEVNGFYTLNKTLVLTTTNPSDWYQIVGAKPKNQGDFMPIIGTGLDATSKPFATMFTIKNNVKFKNVFIANQTLNGLIGNQAFAITAKVRFELDGCVVDPCGVKNFLVANTAPAYGSSIFITNNLLLRQGDKYSPSGGHLFVTAAADTVYVENNSMVSSNHTIMSDGGTDATLLTKFAWFNHNTVVFHAVQLNNSYINPEMYIANNLFYDAFIFPQIPAWAQYDPDNAKTGSLTSVAKSDTLYVNGQYETLPSTRTNFYNRNLIFSSKAHNDSILGVAAADPAPANQLFQYPMVWNGDVPHYYVTDWAVRGDKILAASREGKMYKSADFPKLREANTIYDVDPGFVDTRINTFTKDVASSGLFWYRTNKFLSGTNPAIQASAFWDVDGWAGTTAAYYPTVWPRWNGKYTNPTLLTASNAGLPLGDLNAFPEKKAIWQANKAAIANHIKSLSTEKLSLTGLNSNKMESSVRIFPNPITDYMRIEAANPMNNVKIYSTTGSLVKEINVSGDKVSINVSDIKKGAYLIEIKFVSGGSYSASVIK